MIHVPDVRATAAWYRGVGFEVVAWHAEGAGLSTGPFPEGELDAPLDWACLRYGGGELMLNAGGRPSEASRREVDLYFQLEPGPDQPDVDELHTSLAGRVDVVAAPYDAFHGNRELIIRDLNGFWVTFGQAVV